MIATSIVTYNTPLDELSACLSCIELCPQISTIEIIDNSHNKVIEDFIYKNFKNVKYTPSENVGYGAANNISIKKSLNGDHGDIKYHLVMNSDVAFMPDVITTLIHKLENDNLIGVIMPSVIGRDNKPQSCCHPLPSPLDLLKHRFLPKTMLKKWRHRYDIIPQSYNHDINVPYLHGCFMLFRLDAFRQAGLFDEKFFMYPEDIDITRRVHAIYKTIVTPDAVIYHLHRAESRHSFRMLYIHIINMLRYFAKWGFIFDRQRDQFNRTLHNTLK